MELPENSQQNLLYNAFCHLVRGRVYLQYFPKCAKQARGAGEEKRATAFIQPVHACGNGGPYLPNREIARAAIKAAINMRVDVVDGPEERAYVSVTTSPSVQGVWYG